MQAASVEYRHHSARYWPDYIRLSSALGMLVHADPSLSLHCVCLFVLLCQKLDRAQVLG